MSAPPSYSDDELSALASFLRAHYGEPGIEIDPDWVKAVAARLYELLAQRGPPPGVRGRPRTVLAYAAEEVEILLRKYRAKGMDEATARRTVAKLRGLTLDQVARAHRRLLKGATTSSP